MYPHTFLCLIYRWAVPCKNVSSGIYGQRKPGSDCADAQSDPGLRCPQTEPLDTTECFNGEQMPGWYFSHAQDELNLRIFCAYSKTLFSLMRPRLNLLGLVHTSRMFHSAQIEYRFNTVLDLWNISCRPSLVSWKWPAGLPCLNIRYKICCRNFDNDAVKTEKKQD